MTWQYNMVPLYTQFFEFWIIHILRDIAPKTNHHAGSSNGIGIPMGQELRWMVYNDHKGI